jgi:hypothetical protein
MAGSDAPREDYVAVRWLRRVSVVALVVVAVLSITPSVEAISGAQAEQRANGRTVGAASESRAGVDGSGAWLVTDTSSAIITGNGRPIQPLETQTPRALAGGINVGGALALGNALVLAGVLVLVVRRRRRLS